MPGLLKSSGALLSNESLKLGDPTLVYLVQVKDDGIYALDVSEGAHISRANLMSRICVGTNVSFTVRVRNPRADGSADPNDHAGGKDADDLIVQTPCVQ
jgi:hypothetical protein